MLPTSGNSRHPIGCNAEHLLWAATRYAPAFESWPVEVEDVLPPPQWMPIPKAQSDALTAAGGRRPARLSMPG